MKNIQSYLSRFKNLLTDNNHFNEGCELVFKKINIPLTKKDFIIVSGVIKLKNKNPLVKSEIFLKKEKIIKELNNQFGKSVIFDIR